MDRSKIVIWVLFALFVVANLAYLHRVPGLLGDEASEGENVYELHEREGLTVTGERSYIGPFIDYIRVPFIGVFGYNAFALRVLILLFSVATFWLAYIVLVKQFGEMPAAYGLALFGFSPVFLLYGRLGWAITLFPFFGFLILYLLQQDWKTKWLWAGLAAGVGLANHIIFFPVLVGIGVAAAIHGAVILFRRSSKILIGQFFVSALLCLIGFWAGFGMQFVVLALNTEDQGDPDASTQLFSERVSDAFEAFPLYASGSSYVARYTGIEFSPLAITVITWALYGLMVLAAIVHWKKLYMWTWLIGCSATFFATLYMVDRFTLRYFYVSSLIVWLLAGLGVGGILAKARKSTIVFGALVVAAGLSVWMLLTVLVPFLQTGGSTNDFSLGNRVNSASAFVDVRPLVTCLENTGPVFSENVHIWNRLQYLSHNNGALEVVPEEQKSQAELLIQYRDAEHPEAGEVCPELTHFRVLVDR